MERNLHTYHSFPLNLRHIIVVGLFDHKKKFLETGAVLTLENLLQLIDSLYYK